MNEHPVHQIWIIFLILTLTLLITSLPSKQLPDRVTSVQVFPDHIRFKSIY